METRLPIQKTYKLYIDGKFPRSESGQTFQAGSIQVCKSSRKDFRDAVSAARGAFAKWSAATAYNRGQILYRCAENLEARREQFEEEIERQGSTSQEAVVEVSAAIDRLIYFAGWSDKFQQVYSCLNPVSTAHFSFSQLEPTGVVGILAPEDSALLGLVSLLAPTLIGGNTSVLLASSVKPLTAITFAEVLHSSDVPAGVVNILTGQRKDLLSQFASHMDVNAIMLGALTEDIESEELRLIEAESTKNLKRVCVINPNSWFQPSLESPDPILKTLEIKTTWHPIGL